MDNFLSQQSETIHSLRESIVTYLEQERVHGCRLTPLKRAADTLSETAGKFLDAIGNLHEIKIEQLSTIIPLLENVYLDWHAIQTQLQETLKLAYREMVPKDNLRLDTILAGLEKSLGEPVDAAYTELQMRWRRHLESHPWDSYISDVGGHLDGDEFNAALSALERGDEFDIEDAITTLTGRFRHLLSAHISDTQSDAAASARLASNLWKRPEIVVANDYWQQKHRTKLIDILLSNPDSPPAVGFARVKEVFQGPTGGDNRHIVSLLKEIAHDDRNKFLRCLALHPDSGIRRYAVSNVNTSGFWQSLTPATVPCSTVLSLLERAVGSNHFDDNRRKIFFDSVYKRLLYLTSRAEVLYARGIIRIFTKLDFFLEDLYFEKLMHLIRYIESKERLYQIQENILEAHISELKSLKQKAGSLDTVTPEFGAIPPVVLRKIARDGHFWFELAMHPLFKIAKETIPYINSRDRAVRVVSQKNVNQDVIRAIGKNKSLFSSRSAQLALLGNPRTPPAVSLEYLPELGRSDIEALLRKSTIHPEFRRRLRLKLDPQHP